MAANAQEFIPLNPFAVADVARIQGVRGSDRKKLVDKDTWEDVTRVHEYEDGWYIGYVHTPKDTATFGRIMGHCAGVHFVWTVEEKIWYFFGLFDPDNVPHTTIHGKQASWMHKHHPRDGAESYPVEVTSSKHYPRASYPSFEQIETCFEAVGLKYEPGKYRAPQYTSCTYDFGAGANNDRNSFGYRYGRALVVEGKPQEVSKTTWDAYVKAAKAVETEYDKEVGSIKIQGRRFKFDGKWLILLSAYNKSQGYVQGDNAKKIHEWLNSTTRRSK